jgi:quercetin dioxygenase-like cupin family protein
MPIVDHASQPIETWRPGVKTRLVAAHPLGARQLTVFEQWCDPGLGAPPHVHAVEEILTVLAGTADVHIDAATHRLAAGHSAIIPAGSTHGFTNAGTTTLHVQAILASPIFEAAYEDAREAPRRWSR